MARKANADPGEAVGYSARCLRNRRCPDSVKRAAFARRSRFLAFGIPVLPNAVAASMPDGGQRRRRIVMSAAPLRTGAWRSIVAP